MIAFVALAILLAASCEAAAPAQTQDPTRPLRLEIGLFATDELMYDFVKRHLLDRLGRTPDIFQAAMLSNYIYGLHTAFSDPSIGDLNIQVVITHFEVVPESTWRQWTDLGSFCKYENTKQDLGIDAAILIVRRSGESAKQVGMGRSAGRSYTDTLGSNMHCGVITEDTTLSSAYKRLISHELGHIIGLIDQGAKLQGKLKRSPYHKNLADNKIYPYDDMRCSSNDLKAIMAGSGDTWSVCSKDRLRLLMGSDKSKVAEGMQKPALLPDTRWFMGNFMTHTGEHLCRINVDKYDAEGTKITYKEVHSRPICRFAKGECKKTSPIPGTNFIGVATYDDSPFVTGFRCPTGYCLYGDCLSGKQFSDKMAALTKSIVN
ncbi:uncharacterized protein LOC135499930 [Lineus longissimus]|uniref:uncharacterized protein LOC135499930 n=1 Tax=Lineus longissimus TaxID=88925 RepID=UPI002B4E34B2